MIEFAKPAKHMNMNDRMHWGKRNKLTEAWRQASWGAALAARPGAPSRRRLPWPGRTLVEVSIPCRVHDPHNLAPTMKAIIDGLTDAGLWPDDNSRHVLTAEPLVVGGSTVRVVLSEVA